MIFDLAIIGGGPAGAGAAVYAGRKQLKTIMIVEEFGGQSSVSDTIFNWIGTKAIGGTELAKALQSHVQEYTPEIAGEKGTVTLKTGVQGTKVEKTGDNTLSVTLSNGEHVEAKAVLIATGSRHRKLDVPGALELDHKGIMYCATCDGPLFSDMPVAVIGAGNAAFEAAIQLSQYATHVTLIHRSENFKADPITIDMVKKDPKVTIITNAELLSVEGAPMVERLSYKIKGTDEVTILPLSGIFVEIGQIPNTELVDGLAKRTETGTIIVDPTNQRTDIEGVWAAGDCTNGRYHQNNIAVGDAVKAIEDIYIWLKTSARG